jgi:hypothetical protein
MICLQEYRPRYPSLIAAASIATANSS